MPTPEQYDAIIIGTGAGELLPAVQLAMANNLPYTAIRNLIISHPTMAEGLVSLFSAVPPLPK
jgi:pyruvate/2-oxoglutarate dehydrogenase complex dihydrolipoamide dehydrogenase (E3) component